MSKILCVCDHGLCRSVSLAQLLAAKGYETRIKALYSTSPKLVTIDDIVWSDKTVCLSNNSSFYPWYTSLPQALKEKIIHCDMGPDRWADPNNVELVRLLQYFIEFTTIGRGL